MKRAQGMGTRRAGVGSMAWVPSWLVEVLRHRRRGRGTRCWLREGGGTQGRAQTGRGIEAKGKSLPPAQILNTGDQPDTNELVRPGVVAAAVQLNKPKWPALGRHMGEGLAREGLHRVGGGGGSSGRG